MSKSPVFMFFHTPGILGITVQVSFFSGSDYAQLESGGATSNVAIIVF
jgi:hypothetical protein